MREWSMSYIMEKAGQLKYPLKFLNCKVNKSFFTRSYQLRLDCLKCNTAQMIDAQGMDVPIMIRRRIQRSIACLANVLQALEGRSVNNFSHNLTVYFNIAINGIFELFFKHHDSLSVFCSVRVAIYNSIRLPYLLLIRAKVNL